MVAADLTTTLAGGGAVGALVVAFGYGISLLRSGTERIDAASRQLVAAAEAERDRAIAALAAEREDHSIELDAVRARHREELQRALTEAGYWRDRALGLLPPTTPPPPGANP